MDFHPEFVTAPLSGLAALLSIAASAKRLMETNNNDASSAIKQIKPSLSESEADFVDDGENLEAIVLLMNISSNLLDQLAREAQECEDRYIKKRMSARNERIKQVAKSTAEVCMCGVLRDIKSHNGGRIPMSPVLRRFWKSYRCI